MTRLTFMLVVLALSANPVLSAPAPMPKREKAQLWPCGVWEGVGNSSVDIVFTSCGLYHENWAGNTFTGYWAADDVADVIIVHCWASNQPRSHATAWRLRFTRDTDRLRLPSYNIRFNRVR